MNNEKNSNEISALDNAIGICEKIQEELSSIIDHIHSLNEKCNPQYQFEHLELQIQNLDIIENNIISNTSYNDDDLNTSTQTSTSNDSRNSSQLFISDERTCSAVKQTYSDANYKMIKLKRNAESVWNSIRKMKVNIDKSTRQMDETLPQCVKRLLNDNQDSNWRSIKVENVDTIGDDSHNLMRSATFYRPLRSPKTPKSPSKLKSKIFTLRSISR